MMTRNISDKKINTFLIVSLIIANCMELPYIMYQYFTAGTLAVLLVTELMIYTAHIVLCIRDKKKRMLYKLILIMDGIVFAGCVFLALLNAMYPEGLPEILIIPYGLVAVTCSPCFSLTVNLPELPRYIQYIYAGISDASGIIRVVSVLRWFLLVLIIAGWLYAVKAYRSKEDITET